MNGGAARGRSTSHTAFIYHDISHALIFAAELSHPQMRQQLRVRIYSTRIGTLERRVLLLHAPRSRQPDCSAPAGRQGFQLTRPT